MPRHVGKAYRPASSRRRPSSALSDSLTGNNSGNNITGNNGANTLNGGGGADGFAGRGGDDTYIVDSLSDMITDHGALHPRGHQHHP
jgi:Ca2+-binding RTX toxin-like protein